jgi:hypothetical protein
MKALIVAGMRVATKGLTVSTDALRLLFIMVLIFSGLHAKGAESNSDTETFSGELWKLDDAAGHMIDGVFLNETIAKEVMKFCSVGQQCEIKGRIEHCRGVRGACIEMTRLISAGWSKALPICAVSAAADRANEWWSNNGSVGVRGTIRQSEGVVPYGHMEIVMDLTTCSSGAPMAIVRVPEKWIGHYVDVNGTAIKDGDNWYIIARDVKDVGQ